MQIGEVDKQQSVIYITILAVLQLLLFIFTIASGQRSLVMFNVIRMLLLLGAHCLKNITWAAYYTIFALIAALFAVDPVGLWVTGHGEGHTKTQNAFAFILLLGCIVAVVVGYYYKKALQGQVQEDFVGDAVPAGYSNPNQRNSQFLYRAAENAPSAPRQENKRFEQFTGQAYSLS